MFKKMRKDFREMVDDAVDSSEAVLLTDFNEKFKSLNKENEELKTLLNVRMEKLGSSLEELTRLLVVRQRQRADGTGSSKSAAPSSKNAA